MSEFEDAIEKAVESSEDRNFKESIDLIVNFRDIDLTDPNNRFNEDFKLPYQADEEGRCHRRINYQQRRER